MKRQSLAVLAFAALFATSAIAQTEYCARCVHGSSYPITRYGITGTLYYAECRAAGTGESGRFGCMGEETFVPDPYTYQASPECSYIGPACEVYGPPDPPLDNDDNCGNQCSPAELNLGNGPWRHSGAEDPVYFDLDMDGIREKTAWPARGSEIALLAIDHGLDGIIASGAELFGNRPGYFANAFELLKVYDSNHDGLIDHNDSVWPFLRLWTDRSHDGISQAGELQTLDAAGVQGLSLDYHETARADRNGNEFRQQAKYWRNGQVRQYYDVWLARLP